MTVAKNRVRLAVEQLEDRCTPSALLGGPSVHAVALPDEPPALAAALTASTPHEHAIHIKSTFRCSVDISTGIVSSTGFATGGVGHWTALGHMDNLVIDPAADRGIYRGTGTLVTAHGDQLFYSFTTSWQLSTGIGTHSFIATGGTGRFAGASGSGFSNCIITPDPTSPFIYFCHTEGSGTLFLPNR